ncbi:rhodanese [Croceicoccus naphthovorans]|uniref:Rhodanese n=2 Tax=Croceicoccus naphthovorans TaxID=1348774 RepID=A0A0G3XKR2_9SPHN|nr:rhodanese [Croceicoccus naphthovorans]
MLAVPSLAEPSDSFDADGYRSARYRAPVDRDPRPAARLALPAARLLTPGKDALFIDVLPAMGGVRDAATGKWRLGEEHLTIPGAIWHPEAGRSDADPLLWRALADTVAEARRKRPHLPVILFCRTDCWMGWNAARRLASEGYGNVWWLAEGIEGWRQETPLVPAEPVVVRPE